jgi:organic radical activating enzyme
MDYLTLFLSLRCTQACVHCLYGCSPDYGEHMSWDVFKRSITIALENRIPSLNFFGGEPMLNPQIFPMLQTAFESGLSLILATNCRPLSEEGLFESFLNITRDHKKSIVIITARDKFHLRFFEPLQIINRLQNEGYKVVVNNYSDDNILISEFNADKRELRKLNTRFSCCGNKLTDYLGVLPNGGWTICPPSLVSFGSIFSDDLKEIVKFKSELPLRYKEGCTQCLKDFHGFSKEFEMKKATK